MVFDRFSLKGKTILVTGASSGIGRVTAVECSKMGARVIATGRNLEQLDATQSLMSGNDNTFIAADLTQEDDMRLVVEKLKQIDGIVHCAGVSQMKMLVFATKEVIDKTFNINFYVPVELSRLLIKSKKISAEGSIVFVSSVAGSAITNAGFGIYTASKSAINGIAKSFALELAPKHIRVNCISPGSIATDMLAKSGLSEEQIKEDMKNYPLGRYGTPLDIANAAIFLLSDASTWMTGANLVIDGGYTLK